MRTRGGGGQKIPKFCGRHLWMAPYSDCIWHLLLSLSSPSFIVPRVRDETNAVIKSQVVDDDGRLERGREWFAVAASYSRVVKVIQCQCTRQRDRESGTEQSCRGKGLYQENSFLWSVWAEKNSLSLNETLNYMRVVYVKFIVWVYSMNLSRTFEALLIQIDGLLLRSTVCPQEIKRN